MIEAPSKEAIQRAADAIKHGHLVGMPTETVYGIAADALDPKAVQATFDLKGRPGDNPLIVHLASFEDVSFVASSVPEEVHLLSDCFWPGPLTLVLPKKPTVPDVVTAGLPTVAVRVPQHPVALALLKAAARPLSAPSANKFMGLSPTTAEDIDPEIAAGLALILEGGPCEVGIESTVLDLSGPSPVLLRPGAISREELESVLGVDIATGNERKAPGMYPRHYSPRTRVRLAESLTPAEAGLVFSDPFPGPQIQMSPDPRQYAASLYASLAELDRMGLQEIVIQRPPQTEEWEAVNDRLSKATANRD